MQLKGTGTRRLPSFCQSIKKTITKYLSRLVQKDAPAKLRGRYQMDFYGESKTLKKMAIFHDTLEFPPLPSVATNDSKSF